MDHRGKHLSRDAQTVLSPATSFCSSMRKPCSRSSLGSPTPPSRKCPKHLGGTWEGSQSDARIITAGSDFWYRVAVLLWAPHLIPKRRSIRSSDDSFPPLLSMMSFSRIVPKAHGWRPKYKLWNWTFFLHSPPLSEAQRKPDTMPCYFSDTFAPTILISRCKMWKKSQIRNQRRNRQLCFQ